MGIPENHDSKNDANFNSIEDNSIPPLGTNTRFPFLILLGCFENGPTQEKWDQACLAGDSN
jgi:hypothetical protein